MTAPLHGLWKTSLGCPLRHHARTWGGTIRTRDWSPHSLSHRAWCLVRCSGFSLLRGALATANFECRGWKFARSSARAGSNSRDSWVCTLHSATSPITHWRTTRLAFASEAPAGFWIEWCGLSKCSGSLDTESGGATLPSLTNNSAEPQDNGPPLMHAPACLCFKAERVKFRSIFERKSRGCLWSKLSQAFTLFSAVLFYYLNYHYPCQSTI